MKKKIAGKENPKAKKKNPPTITRGPLKNLLTIQAASKYLNIKEDRLNKLRQTNRGPAYFKFGRVFYDQKSLDQWVKSLRVSTSESK